MSQLDNSAVIAQKQVGQVGRTRRWLVIMLLGLAGGALGFSTSKLISPVYETSTTVGIQREEGLADAAKASSYGGDRDTLQAEAMWFTSRLVLEPVVDRLALTNMPPAGFEKIRGRIRQLFGRTPKGDERRNEILNQLQTKCIKVKKVEGVNALEVRVSWQEPEMTKQIANTLIDVFVEKFQTFNVAQARRAKVFVEEQVKLTQMQLRKSEAKLVSFQKQSGILQVGDKEPGLPAQVALERLKAEKRQLELQMATAQAGHDDLDGHPAVQGEGDKGQPTQALLAARVKASKSQLDKVQVEIDQAKKDLQQLPDELQEYRALTRNLRVNEDLYTKLYERLARAEVDENSNPYNVQVFDLASLPLEPIRPKASLWTTLGALLGLLLGMCVKVLRPHERTGRTR